MLLLSLVLIAEVVVVDVFVLLLLLLFLLLMLRSTGFVNYRDDQYLAINFSVHIIISVSIMLKGQILGVFLYTACLIGLSEQAILTCGKYSMVVI